MDGLKDATNAQMENVTENNNVKENHDKTQQGLFYLKKYKRLQFLRMQNNNLRAALMYEQLKQQDNFAALGRAKLEEEIAIMQENIKNELISKKMQEMMLSWVKLSYDLYEEFLCERTENDQKQFLSQLNEIKDISMKISEEQKEISKIAEMNIEMKLKLRDLKSKKNAVMEAINEGGNMLPEETKKLQAEIRKLSSEVKVLSRILQLLITFSGLNWVDDSDLFATTLLCGIPIEMRLEDECKETS